jgi:hypothetical protein
VSDRELLELAAKAAGVELYESSGAGIRLKGILGLWNPLTNDGDALRLAVELGIGISFGIQDGRVVASGSDSYLGELERVTPDPYAATRRAIVRAAAEIGRDMK